MADEKLPDAVEEALGHAMMLGHFVFSPPSMTAMSAVKAAINRFAREREAAALERAAQVCDAKADVMEQNYRASINDEWIGFKTCYETAAERIRAMIHKEPANG